ASGAESVNTLLSSGALSAAQRGRISTPSLVEKGFPTGTLGTPECEFRGVWGFLASIRGSRFLKTLGTGKMARTTEKWNALMRCLRLQLHYSSSRKNNHDLS